VRIVVVGGGILGTTHAWSALQRGHEVVHLEREPVARGASVRNFGLIWVSGRADGPELTTALRARQLWERIGAAVPGVGFRAAGSLTVCRTDAELAVAKEAVDGPGAATRGFALLDPEQARARNPALRGEYAGALWCERDAVVEPRRATAALRESLRATGRYTWLPGREVRSVTGGVVRDDRGDRHSGDAVVLTTGASLAGLVRDLVPALPVRRVRLQMAQTAPLGEPLPTAVADGDSFRYYPAFTGPALGALRDGQPQQPVAEAYQMQLLMVQRLDGGLTIGDTHAYDDAAPDGFDFDLAEEPYEHLRATAEALLGRPLPPVLRRWAGVYAQCLDPTAVVYRAEVADRVWLVTAPGGRGMTCAPALAEQTADQIGW
jgi:FAD dependent oxidoreductase TIGR03364